MSKTIIEKSLDLVNNLQTVKTNLITAISNKGVEVPASTRLAELSGYIENIETTTKIETAPVEIYFTNGIGNYDTVWYTDKEIDFDMSAAFLCTASSTIMFDGIEHTIGYSPIGFEVESTNIRDVNGNDYNLEGQLPPGLVYNEKTKKITGKLMSEMNTTISFKPYVINCLGVKTYGKTGCFVYANVYSSTYSLNNSPDENIDGTYELIENPF